VIPLIFIEGVPHTYPEAMKALKSLKEQP